MGYHNLEIKEVLRLKNSSLRGLNQNEAESRIAEFGYNELKKEKSFSLVKLFLNQFNDLLIFILIAATIISFIVGELIDAYVIIAILILNAIFGFAQEYKAEKSIELLRKLSSLRAKVIRNNELIEIDSKEVVPGDIVVLEEGDKVPADVRLTETVSMHIDEAILTGESVPTRKKLGVLQEKLQIGDMANMAFSGTLVTQGHGRGIVVETGQKTQLGRIATLVQKVEKEITPLQKKLKEVAKVLGISTLVIAAIIFGLGILRQEEVLSMLLTAIALAVAAVPEGLPAVVTIALAIGVKKLIKKKALIKKLKSIETLGSTTVICSDKTGTLTRNEMTVKKLYVDNVFVDVTGTGYNDKGEFLYQNKKINPKSFKRLLEIAITCNNASDKIGDPTEKALYYLARKANVDRLERTDEIPFSSDKKFMATFHEGFSYYKGAPEVILNMSTHIDITGRVKLLTSSDKDSILKANEELANNALRVLAIAYKIKEKFIFVGLTAMIDPPRKEVKEAIALCKQAGIRPIMITGDHHLTALAIGKKIGLSGKAITGLELDEFGEKELRNIVKEHDIFARLSSEHKLKILEALQDNGEVVAMTGDGVNDAPAVKKADIGISMAVKGTDVTRDASDMVLTDDNFSSIVSAVGEGRIVYDNIKKFVKFLLGANLSEVLIIFIALVIGLPLPLVAIQLLWLNLITDSFPALALGVSPGEPGIMKRKPRDPKESFFKDIKGFIIIAGVVGTIIVLAMFYYFYVNLDAGIDKARTIALTTLIVSEFILVFSCQSERPFRNLFGNKWLILAVSFAMVLHITLIYTPLSNYFHLVEISLKEWGLIVLIGSSRFFIMEIRKFFLNKKPKILEHAHSI